MGRALEKYGSRPLLGTFQLSLPITTENKGEKNWSSEFTKEPGIATSHRLHSTQHFPSLSLRRATTLNESPGGPTPSALPLVQGLYHWSGTKETFTIQISPFQRSFPYCHPTGINWLTQPSSITHTHTLHWESSIFPQKVGIWLIIPSETLGQV